MGVPGSGVATTEFPKRRGRGRPPRTEQERARQRARLIDAAMDAIRIHGPDVSLADMAASAGMSKPILYREFGDKQGIAEAIAVVLGDRLEKQVIDSLAAAGQFDLAGVVTAMVGSLVDLVDGEPQLYGFLVRTVRSSDRGFLDNALVRVIHQRASLIVGFSAGSVDEDELRLLTDAVFGLMFGAVESWQANQSLSKAQVVQRLTSVITAGLNTLAAEMRGPGSSD